MLKSKGYFFIGIALLLIIWFISSLVIDNNIILPKLDAVILALKKLILSKNTYTIILMTLLRVIVTLILSFIITTILVMMSIKNIKLYYIIKPCISLMKSLPVVSIIIVALIIIGHELSPILITSLVVIPLMFEAMYNGLTTIDKNILDEIKMISNVNFLVIRKLFLPLILPFILTSFLQSFGLGLKVMIMAEFICQPQIGMGRTMLYEKQYLELANIFAWTIIIIALVYVFEMLINKVIKKYLY